MSESRIGDRRSGWAWFGLGLGVVGVLWLLWSTAAEPIAPSSELSSVEVSGINPSPDSLRIHTTSATEDVSREELRRESTRRIQVLDARSLEPVEGAEVRPTANLIDLASWEWVWKMSRPKTQNKSDGPSQRVIPNTTFRIGEPSVGSGIGNAPRIDSWTTDANGLVTVHPTRDATIVSARHGSSQGSAQIAAMDSPLQVLIEPPISIRVVDDRGQAASSRRVVAYLVADEDRKGPFRIRSDSDGNAILISLWKELRNWFDGRQGDKVGILIGFASHADWPGVWLPIDELVPNPVILLSPTRGFSLSGR